LPFSKEITWVAIKAMRAITIITHDIKIRPNTALVIPNISISLDIAAPFKIQYYSQDEELLNTL